MPDHSCLLAALHACFNAMLCMGNVLFFSYLIRTKGTELFVSEPLTRDRKREG